MIKPYYQDSAVTLYHGDCKEIVPQLGKFDLLLTDPPYGIGRENGMGGGGVAGLCKRYPSKYDGKWDRERPENISELLQYAKRHIIWGGNYFADILPNGKKWLIWDKQQTMPSYSDAELAWTSLDGASVKIFRYCGNGLMAKEKNRVHPTQKPLSLITWCIELSDKSNKTPVQTILDPFAGSGTTGRAAKDLGRKCTLIEREEKYCEIIVKRMQQEVLDLQ